MWGDNTGGTAFVGVRGEMREVLVIGKVLSEAKLAEAKVEHGVAEGAENDGGMLNGEDCFGG